MKSEAARILKATVLAITAAFVILVTLVLPAEFNIDPLGTGEALGILGLSGSAPGTIYGEDTGYHEDSIQTILQPFESVEYKYRLDKNSSLVFSWSATDTLKVDFHGEPEGGPKGFAQSYRSGKYDQGDGTFTAPFTGIHGWFWENRGKEPITIRLTTAGFYNSALEFRDGFVTERPLDK